MLKGGRRRLENTLSSSGSLVKPVHRELTLAAAAITPAAPPLSAVR
ncbi:hypothetical protein KCP74_12535 [Salmonella enterica subsp. enterica]|nr:hypothetical protein KCP74_12535 [Salmonella enterica subsp. enterica]